MVDSLSKCIVLKLFLICWKCLPAGLSSRSRRAPISKCRRRRLLRRFLRAGRRGSGTGHVRRSQWSETIEMLKGRPILGAGLAGYKTALEPYHKATYLEIFQYPHTLLLNIWVELGVLGLLAFGLLSYRVAKSAISNFHFPISIAFFPLLAMTLHSLFDVPYFKNDLAAMTWIFLAVVAATYAKNSRVCE